MIINVAIYLDVEGKFPPDEGRTVAVGIRREFHQGLFKYLQKDMIYKDSLNGKTYKVRLLSENEAVQKFARTDPPKTRRTSIFEGD